MPVVGVGPDDGDIRDRAVRDPHLRAVEDPVVAVAAGAGAHRARVASPQSGSVSPKQPMTSPAAIRGSHSCFCSSRAAPPDREHGERALHRDEAAHPAVARLELQAREAVGGRARAGAAVALEVHAEQPELAQLLRQLLGNVPASNQSPTSGGSGRATNRRDRVADQPLLVVQQAVDIEKVARIDRRVDGGRHGDRVPPNSAVSSARSPAESGVASAARGSASWSGRRAPVTSPVSLRLGKQPGKREGRAGRAARRGEAGEALEPVPDRVVVDQMAVRLGPQRHPRPSGAARRGGTCR